MKLRKFQAANIKQAIDKVKKELGEDAMIVATREIRRGVIGSGVEVTAAIDEEPVLPQPPPPKPEERGPISDVDVERIMAPLRSELRSIRSQLRPTGENDSTDIAREVAAMRRELSTLARPGHAAILGPRPALRELIATYRITAPSSARIVSLIGPTGAGKTTTIAKLAARDALIEQRSVALLSLDTFRVGGVDQIRIFADLIGVPLTIVNELEALSPALDRLRGFDRVFVDTAGKSPRDLAAIDELARAFARMKDVEVHLALPAATPRAIADDWMQRYGVIDVQRLLYTKVDEAPELTELVEAPARSGHPISFITTGQRVPEDLEDATEARLLDLAERGFTPGEEVAA